MANLFIEQDRRVVPNWRSFGRTTVLGELSSHLKNSESKPRVVGVDDYLIDFRINQTVIHTSDLLSAAIVNNYFSDEINIAAKFILNNQATATYSQISLAHQILETKNKIDLNNNFNQIDFENVESIINIKQIRTKIHDTRKLIYQYPYNPILYVEISRYYSILGEEEKSIIAMKSALHLAGDNRFVIRSASRLFAHVNYEDNEYLEYIHGYLRKSELTKKDPWIMSAEISISTIMGRSSKFIKRGINLINSDNISPFSFTELASSIGTVELLSGSHKKSIGLFEKAKISPNDNSLAQLEWASEKDNRIKVKTRPGEVTLSYEALALDDYQNGRYDSSIENAMKWLKDMPYSKRPVMFGSNLASTVLKDHKKAFSFLKAGIISHPHDPQVVNNLAYAYSLDNLADKAFEELKKVQGQTFDDVTDACLLATTGLAHFRSGSPEEGRRLYLKAIEKTSSSNNRPLNWIAILNYAREEILQKSKYVPEVMTAVEKIPSNTGETEIRILKNDVLKLFERLIKN